MTTLFIDNYCFLARYNRWINQKTEHSSVPKTKLNIVSRIFIGRKSSKSTKKTLNMAQRQPRRSQIPARPTAALE